MMVMPAANSLEALAEVRKEMDVKDDEHAPEFKWSVGEWRYAAWKASEFNGISSKLRSLIEQVDVATRAQELHADMIAALQLLDQQKFFGVGEARNEVFYLFQSATMMMLSVWRTNRRGF